MPHPSGQNFNQGRGLPGPWWNSDHKGELSLSYVDTHSGLFFSNFSKVFLEHKKSENVQIVTFYIFDLHYSLDQSCFYRVL